MYYDELTGVTFKNPCGLFKLNNSLKSLILEFMDLEWTIAEMEFLRKEAKIAFKMAQKYSKIGDRYMYESYMNQIKKIQKKIMLDINLKDLSVDEEAEKNYLTQSIEIFFIELENSILQNNTKDIKWYSQLIKTYAQRLNQNYMEKLDNILNTPSIENFNPIDTYIQKAEKYASQGDELLMKYYIHLAEQLKIPEYEETIASISIDPVTQKNFISNEIDSVFHLALIDAKKGDHYSMKYNIKTILYLGKQINENVEDKISKINELYQEFKYSKSF